MPWIPIAIGAGAGLLKTMAVDAPEEKRQREIAEATIKYSPWTHASIEKAQASIHPANAFSGALEGAGAGMAFGQGLQNYQTQQNVNDWLKKGYSPFNTWGGSPGAAAFMNTPDNTSKSYKMPALGSSFSGVKNNHVPGFYG